MIKITAIVLGVALAVAPSMAMAGSTGCSVAYSDDFCHTDSLHANSQFHFLHIDVSGPCDLFTVVDNNNGLTVYQHSSGWGGFQKTLGNVYSDYSVYVYGGTWPITNVTISN
jgi:hypothetical protein